MTELDFLIQLPWRATVNHLTELLGCTRFQAAELLTRAWNEGYNFSAI